MKNFGLVHLRAEGAPGHPEDYTWECSCETCKKRMLDQAKAYFDYWRAHGVSEEQLSQESMYMPPV